MDLPSHPDADDAAGDPRGATNRNWGTIAIVVVGGSLLALLVILHLSGAVGPGPN